jgi:hypothetical protein
MDSAQKGAQVIVGDASIFAIESGITQAYERPSLRALGFFVIHVAGHRYGVHTPDATMLANSFDEVKERFSNRAQHTAFFAGDSAGKIADCISRALYAEEQEGEQFFGMTQPDFRHMIHSHDLLWAPDGDAAFDDGSYVLQFDVEDRVRLIAFRRGEGCFHIPASLSDAWIPADTFYGVLRQWHHDFEAEWASTPKILTT